MQQFNKHLNSVVAQRNKSTRIWITQLWYKNKKTKPFVSSRGIKLGHWRNVFIGDDLQLKRSTDWSSKHSPYCQRDLT